MPQLRLSRIQSLLKHTSSLRMHIFCIEEDGLFQIDNGLRSRLDNGMALYEELRQTLKQALTPGAILHLQDSLGLHYAVIPLQENRSSVCALGPFVTEDTEENGLLLHIRQELDIPYIPQDDVLAAAQSILLLMEQTYARPVLVTSLRMDPAMLVQLTSGQYHGSHAVIRRIVYYIQANLHAKLTLESLSERFGFSPTYISHHFKDEVGIPPMQYIARQRMQYAQYLLRTTDKPVHEIAGSVGCPDWSYFTKQFRKYTGMTPTAYRKEYA